MFRNGEPEDENCRTRPLPSARQANWPASAIGMLSTAMTSVRAGLRRSRPWAALALMALAAAALVRPMVLQLSDPDWPEADEFQHHLDSWVRVLAPVEELVPQGETLGYACPLDAQGQPVTSLSQWFDFMRAVLAPRRITRQVESRYILAHSDLPGSPPRVPGLERTRVLAELAKGVFLLERTGP